MKLVSAACLSLCCAALSASAEQRNPFEGDEVAIRAGAQLFAARCALCHGPDAKGQLGPDLTQRWTRGETDEPTRARS
jgi:mono/diheme cytochrome c family protein